VTILVSALWRLFVSTLCFIYSPDDQYSSMRTWERELCEVRGLRERCALRLLCVYAWATARDRDTSMVVAAFSGEHFRYARRLARILKSAVACSSIFAVYNLRNNMENHICWGGVAWSIKIGEAPRSNGTQKNNGSTLGFLRDVHRCLFVHLEIRTKM